MHTQTETKVMKNRQSENSAPPNGAAAPSILEQLPVGVFVHDAAGTILVWNPHMETITGYERAEVVGRPADEIAAGLRRLRNLDVPTKPENQGAAD